MHVVRIRHHLNPKQFNIHFNARDKRISMPFNARDKRISMPFNARDKRISLPFNARDKGFRCHSNTTFTIRFSMHGYGILWRHRKYYKSDFECHVQLKDTSSFEFEWAATNRLYSIYFAIQAL